MSFPASRAGPTWQIARTTLLPAVLPNLRCDCARSPGGRILHALIRLAFLPLVAKLDLVRMIGFQSARASAARCFGARGAGTLSAVASTNLRALTAQVEHDALHARSHVVGTEAKLFAHLQHAGVFGEHVAIDAPHPFFFAALDGALHQHPAEAVSLEARAHHDREFHRLFVELLLQAHEPQHLARLFVERDENDVVSVEMGELLPLRGAELGNIGEKPKPQILGANVGEQVSVQWYIFRPRPPDQPALATAARLVQVAPPKLALLRLLRHRRDAHPRVLLSLNASGTSPTSPRLHAGFFLHRGFCCSEVIRGTLSMRS